MNNIIDEFYEQITQGRCHPCKFAKCVIANGGYMFLGCFCGSYNGKPVSEIKVCPKGEVNAQDMQD